MESHYLICSRCDGIGHSAESCPHYRRGKREEGSDGTTQVRPLREKREERRNEPIVGHQSEIINKREEDIQKKEEIREQREEMREKREGRRYTRSEKKPPDIPK